jgi:hypothetical protein
MLSATLCMLARPYNKFWWSCVLLYAAGEVICLQFLWNFGVPIMSILAQCTKNMWFIESDKEDSCKIKSYNILHAHFRYAILSRLWWHCVQEMKQSLNLVFKSQTKSFPPFMLQTTPKEKNQFDSVIKLTPSSCKCFLLSMLAWHWNMSFWANHSLNFSSYRIIKFCSLH